jgi:uncharacterized protein (DUF2235 family)
MPKRIILLLDGTWNDADFGVVDTNIVRLREIIANCLDGSRSQPPDQVAPAKNIEQTTIVHGTYKANKDYLVFYERGVGTGGLLDPYFGGAFGVGLDRTVRRAYNFLAANYEKDDEIFVFGFSRGSFTARSLVGFIGCSGLLRAEACTPENLSKLWSFYRTNAFDRALPTRRSWNTDVHSAVVISCLAVFETVGALGIPLPRFWRENRDFFEFHDVSLSRSVKLNLQALAIDEHRISFEPAIWRKPKFGSVGNRTEQVWFSGAHADVGGGYIDEERRRRYGLTSLDDLSLDWMLKRLLQTYPDFPVKRNARPEWIAPVVEPSDKITLASTLMAARHESRSGFYRLATAAQRSIGNRQFDVEFRESVVAYDRHAEPINEKIHFSAIERLGRAIQLGSSFEYYAPKNLVSLLVAAHFKSQELLPLNISIVGNAAMDLNQTDADDALSRAKERLEQSGKL